MYQDGVLVTGSLDALIELLIPTPTHYPERSYVFAFILCSRLFLRPYQLLARVARVSSLASVAWSTSVYYYFCVQIFQLKQKQFGSSAEVSHFSFSDHWPVLTNSAKLFLSVSDVAKNFQA